MVRRLEGEVMWLLLVNPQIWERVQKNSGDLPINAMGTSEEVLVQSHPVVLA